jgi:hypothetical protein
MQFPQSNQELWKPYAFLAGCGLNKFSLKPSSQGANEAIKIGHTELFQSGFNQKVIIDSE